MTLKNVLTVGVNEQSCPESVPSSRDCWIVGMRLKHEPWPACSVQWMAV